MPKLSDYERMVEFNDVLSGGGKGRYKPEEDDTMYEGFTEFFKNVNGIFRDDDVVLFEYNRCMKKLNDGIQNKGTLHCDGTEWCIKTDTDSYLLDPWTKPPNRIGALIGWDTIKYVG